ncbi:hypothetical protein [Geobacter metallireducens]|nr:hypothetical protein [Geobacter metallireducens]
MSDLFDSSGPNFNVVLPCTPETFKEFVSGLLGAPQTITREFEGSYEVHQEDIVNLYHLIDQRVSQQNPSTCVQFTVKTIYDDGSTVKQNSLSDFCAYNEIRPVISVGLVITWTYLVKFRDKAAPEKQIITVSFGQTDKIIASRGIRIKFLSMDAIDFRIDHTGRTWGADIEALLTNHINNITKKEPNIKKIVRKNSELIGLLLGGSLFITTAIAGVMANSDFLDKQQKIAADILRNKSADIGNMLSKLEYLINQNASGQWHIFYNKLAIMLFVALFASIIIGIVIAEAADNREPSFILLTKKSQENKNIVLKKMKKKWVVFIISSMLSIALGILSNIIYNKYF